MKKAKILVFVIGIVTLLFSCAEPESERAKDPVLSNIFYKKAQKAAAENQLDSALFFLTNSMEVRYKQPQEITADNRLYPLISNPDFRPYVRALLKKHSAASHSVMVNESEAGERIFIAGKISDERDNTPLGNVSVELIQADAAGLYFPEKNSKFNPRLFAELKTDEKGTFSVLTVRPGSYPDDDNNSVPPHIHFNLDCKGYRPFNSEFQFSDDSLFQKSENAEGFPVAVFEKNEDAIRHYRLLIRMQRK